MHPMLNTAVKAARKAGSIITRSSYDLDKLTVRTKRQNDFVSEVDHAAEDAIISTLKEAYPEAQAIVRVRARHIFPNCPRYIHRMQVVEASPYVPAPDRATPVPGWKRSEAFRDYLPRED